MEKRIKRMLQELEPEARQKIWLDLSEQMEELEETQEEKTELMHLGDIGEDIIEGYKNFGKVVGLSTGYPSLDKLTKGLEKGEVTVIAGKTSHGKSALGINIAHKVSEAGKTVLFLTLEMTKKELGQRLYHISDKKDPAEWNILSQVRDELDWKNIDAVMENAVENGVDLVVIDHLHYFTRELENTAEDLGRVTKEIKKNAIRHELPIILISHVRKTNKEANIEDLRGSSYIAQDADIVLMVYRKKSEPENFYVEIQKNRNRGFDYDDPVATLGFDKTHIFEKQLSNPFIKE